MCPLFFQEDDIDGIHIVAFAEEEDPGENVFPLNGFLPFLRLLCYP